MVLAAFAAFLAVAPIASAAGPRWKITTLSDTQADVGDTVVFQGQLENLGSTTFDASSGHPIVITGEFPPGLELTNVQPIENFDGFDQLNCIESPKSFTCTNEVTVFPPYNANGGFDLFNVNATVEPGASGVLTSSFEVKGGDAAETSDSWTDSVRISAQPPAFGLDAFDVRNSGEAGSDFNQAGGHPDASTTSFDLNVMTKSGLLQASGTPVEPVKDVIAELPPGFIANPSAAARCDLAALSNASLFFSQPLCPPESQVGGIELGFSLAGVAAVSAPIPVFNMEPPPGVVARLGFATLGVPVVIDAVIRNGGDYGANVVSRNVSQGLLLPGATLEVWGVPASDTRDPERACPGQDPPLAGPPVAGGRGESCESEAAEVAFMRMPTSCADEASGLLFGIRAASWFHPGDFDYRTVRTHAPSGYPLPTVPSTFPAGYSGPTEWGAPQGPTNCEEVPFDPSISVQPTTPSADSPTGLEVDLEVPQESLEEPLAISSSDLKDVKVTLPKGLSVNPSSAAGLDACTPAQVGLLSAVGDESPEFGEEPSCPAASKIGTIEIETPLLEEHVKGSVYLAQQGQNPFGSLLATYIVARANGVVLTLAGKISPTDDGQLVARFSGQPQLPFNHLHLSFFGGPRAALRTPPTCGTYTTEAELAPWARPDEPVSRLSSFQITQGCGGGFDPKLSAGTENPLAGTYSPFNLQLSREDGSQELAGLRLTVPKGLLANLKGIPYCSDATLAAISGDLGTGQGQLDAPSCPAASAVGTVTVGAGAGANPFYTSTGKAYWAGPYKGAPVSLAVVVPAVAGPFDLGSVVVRNGFEVDPESAQITAVADPFPTVLHGIPIDLRDVRLNLDRPNYTLNPTSCEPMSFDSTITSTQGATASPTERFQVAGCDQLAFRPKLSLKLKGKTNRGDHPALRAVLRMREGGANIAKARVTLPKAQLLDNSHIRTICTRVQYAADQCPAASVYGYASAYSPILDYYLQGPVYLRSSDHQLPDLVASLDGQIHIDVVGRVDSVKGRLRTTFESVPDAPVSKFVLSMQGGKKGLLVNERELCATKARADVQFDGQNGKISDYRPLVTADCASGRKRKLSARSGSSR